MESKIKHVSGYQFKTSVRGHTETMDVPVAQGGQDIGPTPKEALLSSMAACSGMDVVALLGKYKVKFQSLEITAAGQTTTTQPKVFMQVDLIYDLKGEGLEAEVEKVRQAVELSMTKYCGVSAMVSKAVPIFYTIIVNDEVDSRGQAKFFEA